MSEFDGKVLPMKPAEQSTDETERNNIQGLNEAIFGAINGAITNKKTTYMSKIAIFPPICCDARRVTKFAP